MSAPWCRSNSQAPYVDFNNRKNQRRWLIDTIVVCLQITWHVLVGRETVSIHTRCDRENSIYVHTVQAYEFYAIDLPHLELVLCN